MSLSLEQFGIDRLTYEQKQELMGLIWDSMVEKEGFTPPQWHRDLLDTRLKDAEENPGALESWESVQARLKNRG